MADFMYHTTDEDCREEIGQLADRQIDTRHLLMWAWQQNKTQEENKR